MKIVIESIPKSQQRYDTLGDWWIERDGSLQIRVSSDDPDAPTELHQFLIALHELVEVRLCQSRGVSQQQVDDFDFAYKGDGEPGDEPDAPYRNEHRFAMLIEHLMANELGLRGYGVVR